MATHKKSSNGKKKNININAVDALLQEHRTFPPAKAFKAQAHINDEKIYALAAKDPEKFWADQARILEWFKPWK